MSDTEDTGPDMNDAAEAELARREDEASNGPAEQPQPEPPADEPPAKKK